MGVSHKDMPFRKLDVSLSGARYANVYVGTSPGVGIVSCDWFTLSTQLASPYDGHPLVERGGWSCLKMSPTAVWGERWFVLDGDGNKVATLLFSPRTPKIACTACNVQIANRWLYYDDFHSICDRVLDILPMAIRGLNRVDLCCDFEMTEELWGTYIKLAKKEAKLKALKDSVVYWKSLPVGVEGDGEGYVEIPNQQSWGGQESTFKWKVYYKWLELATAPPEEKKPWIVDMWRAFGMRERAMWRVEVSISKPNQLCNMLQKNIPAFAWYDERVRLFRDIYADKFVVRLKEGHKDIRNDKILPFLDVGGCKSVRHGLPSSSREGSDPEKRLTCKLWQELQQGDTRCNEELTSMLKGNLMQLLERPSNVWVLERMYGVDIQQISDMLS